MKRPLLAVLLGALVVGWLGQSMALAEGLDCTSLPCAEVLPGATRFEPVEGAPYLAGFDASGNALGWVVRSTDVIDVKAYSGKPLVTLLGLDTKGTIVGVNLLEHSEPILLVGIPVERLYDFISHYVGLPATARVVVGHPAGKNSIAIDIISGATVTSLAQNQTILKTARTLGVDVGVVNAQAVNPGHFVVRDQPMTWKQMADAHVFGRLTVTEKQMGVPDPDGAFVNLWFTIADPPQLGRALMGDANYRYLTGKLKPDEHLLVVLGNGSSSFKGSGYVRGGIFDRIRLEQGMRELTFHDVDHTNLPEARAKGAPQFKEGGIFVIHGGTLDPGAPFDLVFLGSRYDQRGAFTRDFREFRGTLRLPSSVYVTEGGPLDEAMYVQAWRNRRTDVILLGSFLLIVIAIFALRRFTTADPKRIKWLHVGVMLTSFFMVGVYMHAQPSVTQLLTLFDSTVHGWRWGLFASAPLIFMLWIFIAITSVIWGRGIFCGWVCPYGTMTELINKAAIKLKVPQLEIRRTAARFLRYAVFAALIPIFMHNSVLGEKLAEIEPFKSTFLVPFWTREAYIIAWWVLLVGLAVFTYRPFCRFLCPLGAGLALFGSLRRSGPRRRKFCSSCNICARNCEPAAILPDGTIDPRECLSCMDCEATYRNEEVCPPLIGIERLLAKHPRSERDEGKLAELREAKKDV